MQRGVRKYIPGTKNDYLVVTPPPPDHLLLNTFLPNDFTGMIQDEFNLKSWKLDLEVRSDTGSWSQETHSGGPGESTIDMQFITYTLTFLSISENTHEVCKKSYTERGWITGE